MGSTGSSQAGTGLSPGLPPCSKVGSDCLVPLVALLLVPSRHPLGRRERTEACPLLAWASITENSTVMAKERDEGIQKTCCPEDSLVEKTPTCRRTLFCVLDAERCRNFSPAHSAQVKPHLPSFSSGRHGCLGPRRMKFMSSKRQERKAHSYIFKYSFCLKCHQHWIMETKET